MTVLYSLIVFTNFCLSCKNHNKTVADAKKKFAPSSPSSNGLEFRYFYLLPVFSSLFQNFHFFFLMERRLDWTLIKCIVAIQEVTKYLV